MTVGELIEELGYIPENEDIHFSSAGAGFYQISAVLYVGRDKHGNLIMTNHEGLIHGN